MKRSALIPVLFLIAAQALFAQADPDWFWNKPIASVQWVGLHGADANELDSLIKDYTGKAFTEELWLDLQAKLYALDWFETIESVALPSDSSNSKLVLRFTVKEKPSVTAVKISGNERVRTAELLDVVVTKPGTIYNPSRADLDDLEIKRVYSEKGYPSTVVTHAADVSGDGTTVSLKFAVTEGEQVGVRAIRFSGNASISERVLKGQMTLKEAALFQSGAFQEAKLEESNLAIVDYYRNKGYLDAKITDVLRSYEKDEKSGKNWLILTVSISEGRQWNFGGMSFSGNTVFSTDRLQQLITLKKGSPINNKKLVQDKQKIDDLYYESGYIFNSIEMKETRDEASAAVSYLVAIQERDRAHIESLSVQGNEKTKSYVIEREIPLEAGDIFSKAKIVDGLRNLYNLQYFSAVEPRMTQGSGENLMDLVVVVEEQSTADIQFGVTLSGLGQPGVFPLSGFVKWNDRNLGGRGQTLSADLTASPTEQSLAFSFGESWLFGKRINGGLTLSFSHKSDSTGQDSIAPIFASEDIPDPFTASGTASGEWNGTLSSIPAEYLMPYENWNMSLGFNAGYTLKTMVGDLGLGGGVMTGLGMRFFDADQYRPYLFDLREANEDWRLYNKLYARAYINDLDFWYNPTNGYYASQRLTWTGLLPSEFQHYLKSETRLDGYLTMFSFPITDTWKFSGILGLHSGFQALFAQPGTDLKITEDWVSLDGTFNARGWRSLYGTEGVSLWENSLELRFPIVDQVLWLDLFVDGGAVRTETGMVDMTRASPIADPARPGFGDLGWSNMAFSTGLGLRFVIPQFPFRFYFVKRFTTDGTALTWQNSGSGWDFVLSITQPLY
ncbi:MAG: outer membrane protein assembly factor BamA [Rectinemataceae bacterium]